MKPMPSAIHHPTTVAAEWLGVDVITDAAAKMNSSSPTGIPKCYPKKLQGTNRVSPHTVLGLS